MSRSLGDLVAHRAGVSPEPEVCSVELHEDDAFLIVASDGVWEFMTNQEAAEIVATCDSASRIGLHSCKSIGCLDYS